MNSIWIASMILQWVLILTLSLLVFSLLRQLGELNLRMSGSAREPEAAYALFSMVSKQPVTLVNGETFYVGGTQNNPSLIVYFSPTCSACEQLPQAILEFARANPPTEMNLLVVIKANRAAVENFIVEKSMGNISITLEEDFPLHLRPGGAPFAAAITASGAVAARGKPKSVTHLLEMAQATRTMVDLAPSHSQSKHEWGESVPYWNFESKNGNGITDPGEARALVGHES